MRSNPVTISSTGFIPDPVIVRQGDSIQWLNATGEVQDATGETFTTGPIQPGAASLPISFDLADPGLRYGSVSSGLTGTVIIQAAAPVEAVIHWPEVRALFTDEDVQHMLPFDLNLASKDDVCANAAMILDRVTRMGVGRMPRPPRPKWSDNQVDLLRKWKVAGCPD